MALSSCNCIILIINIIQLLLKNIYFLSYSQYTCLCRELDPGLEEAIASLIWATPRLQADIQEFKPIADEFAAKYGKEFALACRSNELSNVSEKVMHKLSVQAPAKTLVERYMVEIAKSYSILFEPDASVMAQDEILLAENLLIDFDADKKGKSGNSGGGPSGGMGVMQSGPAQVCVCMSLFVCVCVCVTVCL